MTISTVRKSLPYLLLWGTLLQGQKWEVPNLVADTLTVPLPTDSLEVEELFPVEDHRSVAGPYLGVRQKTKLMNYIPVDEYLLLNEPLSVSLGKYISRDTTDPGRILVVENLTLWYDKSIPFNAGWVLNGYTCLLDASGETVRDWQWEVREKKKKKDKTTKNKTKGFKLFRKKNKKKKEDILKERFSDLMGTWMKAQAGSLSRDDPPVAISPYRYRRQLLTWMDMILFPDGFGLEGRLSLDYPSDQRERYERGIPGIYYRRGPFYETAAVQRKTKLWYRRFGENMLVRSTVTRRFGVNGYDHTKFDFLHFTNIFSLGATVSAVMEYRPRYHRGLFWGAGVLAGVNLLSAIEDIKPQLIKGDVPLDTFELGLILTAGVSLP